MKIAVLHNERQVDAETVRVWEEALRLAGSETAVFSCADDIEDADRLLVLGGDGTMLRAARRAAVLQLPLLGVNFGRLGFLTEFERGEMQETVRLVLSERPVVVERSMLQIAFNGQVTHCLNEFALLREVVAGQDNRVADISVALDGTQAAQFHADGIIVSTPTGSTAYSLSAGGSIVTPDCACFLLTPVCAFSMRSRPIIYPDRSTLSFFLPKGEELLLYGDGIYLGTVGERDVVTVTKSPRSATFITRDKNRYFRRLTEKIN